MFTQIKLKLSTKKIAFWSYIVITAVFAVIFYFSYAFLMENAYRVITGEKISSPGKEAVEKQDEINITLFNDVIKKINEKTTSSTTRENIENPFD